MFELRNGRLVTIYEDGTVLPLLTGADDGDDDGDKNDDDPAKDDKKDDPPKDDPKDKKELDDEGRRAETERARKEAAKYRTERNDLKKQVDELKAQQDKFKKLLGGDDDDDLDPEKVKAEIAARESKIRELTIHNAFITAAQKAGADVELAWAVLRDELRGIELEGDELTKELSDRITEALKSRPKLKAESAPGRSGSDFNDKGKDDKDDMNALIRRRAGVS